VLEHSHALIQSRRLRQTWPLSVTQKGRGGIRAHRTQGVRRCSKSLVSTTHSLFHKSLIDHYGVSGCMDLYTIISSRPGSFTQLTFGSVVLNCVTYQTCFGYLYLPSCYISPFVQQKTLRDLWSPEGSKCLNHQCVLDHCSSSYHDWIGSNKAGRIHAMAHLILL